MSYLDLLYIVNPKATIEPNKNYGRRYAMVEHTRNFPKGISGHDLLIWFEEEFTAKRDKAENVFYFCRHPDCNYITPLPT